ncbi:hypothetical protein [Algoriphagus chordae]|uniref:Uncharacterized protein n=1 Tax=Algoriphagus chordae TaxID=237019 RepID=A0A2W7R939_9BACT|nr:hypothetical protein [Algoriphagus chordae]PZX55616.1 hypothetical protein LV85_00841 [Algoriphagus chordae]
MSDFDIDKFSDLGTLIATLEKNPDKQMAMLVWVEERTEEFKTAAKAASAASSSKATKETYNRQVSAIAKGLPVIATGIQGAVKSFQGGNPIAGSAAVADVVGNMVTMISSIVSASGGPPGAIVSSILSIFSMILKMFSEQKPEKSIEQKLQSVIDTHDAKELKDSLQAIQIEINTVIDEFISHTKSELKFPFDRIQKSLDIENKGLKMTQAGQWIKRNQDVEHWDAVLAGHCYAHLSLMQAFTMAMNIVEKDIDITYLTAMLKGRNKMQLEFIQEIKPAAQNQGTVWAARNRSQNDGPRGSVIFKRNAVVSHQKEWQKYTLKNTPLGFAVSKRTSEMGNQKQSIALFTIDNTYPFAANKDWVREKSTLLDHPFRKDDHASSGSGILSARYGTSPLSSRAKEHTLVRFNTNSKPDYFDVWAIPGHNIGEIDLYTAEGKQITFWRQGSKEHTADEETKLLFRGQFPMPDGYKVGMVRAVVPKPFEDEENTLSIDTNHVIYGACEVLADKSQAGKAKMGMVMPTYNSRDHMEISVGYRGITWDHGNIQQPTNQFMVSPWANFVGIGVDSRYLWVYKAGAIACATHTEVFNSLEKGGNSQLPWMIYDIPKKVGETAYDPQELGFLIKSYYPKGLLDLSPCDDETLVALYCEKTAWWQAPIYSLSPKIDRVARTLKMEGSKRDSNDHIVPTNGWDSDRTVWVSRVIKQPIDCWPLLSSLEKILMSLNDSN